MRDCAMCRWDNEIKEKCIRLENDINTLSRKEITSILSELVESCLVKSNGHGYWASEVTFDWATDHSIRVDYMKFKPLNNTVSGIEKGDVYCYEVKSSVEDFKSKNGHNFLGDYNYYVMPYDVYFKIRGEIPYWIGVYSPKDGELKCIDRAHRRDRTRPVSEVLLMMLRSGH